MGRKWVSPVACIAARLSVCILLMPMAQSQTFQVIHTFSGGQDGGKPMAGLTMDRAGNLYGTTPFSGNGGCGTIFKLTYEGSAWTYHTLYAFKGQPDACNPEARLVIASDGNLFGTSLSGGTGTCTQQGYGPGCGTVFKLNPPPTICASVSCPWQESVLYSFQAGSDGSYPQAVLVFDQQGNLYGTTNAGGSSGCEGGCGTVFELSPGQRNWTESILYRFQDLGYGAGIASGVIVDKDGNLYGAAKWGGADGREVVYELVPSEGGWTQSVLHSFTPHGIYAGPVGGLIFDTTGSLYGTTAWGCGTAFGLAATNGGWNFENVFDFSGANGCPFGWGPRESLTFDTAGNLLGTTTGGPSSPGYYEYGSVFELMPSSGGWIGTSLHAFTGGSDGGFPISNVVLDASGNMYGTASCGGNAKCQDGLGGAGVVWEITRSEQAPMPGVAGTAGPQQSSNSSVQGSTQTRAVDRGPDFLHDSSLIPGCCTGACEAVFVTNGNLSGQWELNGECVIKTFGACSAEPSTWCPRGTKVQPVQSGCTEGPKKIARRLCE